MNASWVVDMVHQRPEGPTVYAGAAALAVRRRAAGTISP